MSDAYSIPSFFSADPRGGALTAEQLEARRKVAMALATRNRPYPKTIGEGLTALGEGLGEGYFNRQLSRAEALQKEGDAAAMRGPAGVAPPAPAAAPAPGAALADDDPMNALAMASSEDVEKAPPQVKLASMPVGELKQRLARNETGGQPNPYRAIGPQSRRGDFPYGKYQVMGENIPKWTKTYLGKELTPQEFLESEEAQERVADGQGGKYLAKYGPIGAAEAWFAGEKGRVEGRSTRKDTLGTHIDEYVRRFNVPLVDRNQIAAAVANAPAAAPAFAPEESTAPPVQLASLGGMPTPDTVPDPARDAIAQTLAAQQQPRPAPLQQVAQAAPAAPPIIPKAPVRGTQQPSPIPEPPPYPAYGSEPKPPRATDEMIHWQRVGRDPYRSEGTQLAAREKYKELKAAQDAAFLREHGIWKEHQQKERDYNLGLPAAREKLKSEYLENLKKPQGIITGAETPQPVDPALLGTDRSPQRTGIPALPPKPADLTQEDWAKQQAPLAAKAIEAVDSAEPDFKSMLRVIDEVRNHPGKEWGTGLLAGYAPRGTAAYAFSGGPEEGIVGQLKSKTFLSAYEKLRGGGAITTVEGSKGQQATAAVNPAAGKDALDKALNNLESQIRSDLEIVQRKTNRPVTAWQKTPDDEFAPDIGEIGTRGGKVKEYIGGDPSKDSSYRTPRR